MDGGLRARGANPPYETAQGAVGLAQGGTEVVGWNRRGGAVFHRSGGCDGRKPDQVAGPLFPRGTRPGGRKANESIFLIDQSKHSINSGFTPVLTQNAPQRFPSAPFLVVKPLQGAAFRRMSWHADASRNSIANRSH